MKFSEIEFPTRLFITGTGTDVGKSFVTGWLAREMNAAGIRCVTQKMVQTGNTDMSEDIMRHRKIMGWEFLPEDLDKTTAPVIFTYPASPHLAARLDNSRIDLCLIDRSADKLEKKFGHLLMEGAGGLMVPLEGNYLCADYIASREIPVVVTVTGQLGSINHALLTFKTLRSYGIHLFAVVYNPYFDKDRTICADTREYLKTWLSEEFPDTLWMEMPVL